MIDSLSLAWPRVLKPIRKICEISPKRGTEARGARLANRDLRTREYLTEAEVERLMKVATRNRWGHRDSTMVLVAYRHNAADFSGH
jgi:hypothetical protein